MDKLVLYCHNSMSWGKQKHKAQLFIQDHKEFILTLEDPRAMEGKERLYRFFHGPLLQSLVKHRVENGEPITMEKMKRLLKIDFLRLEEQNGISFIPSLSDLTKNELYQFIQCCHEYLVTSGGSLPYWEQQEYNKLGVL